VPPRGLRSGLLTAVLGVILLLAAACSASPEPRPAALPSPSPDPPLGDVVPVAPVLQVSIAGGVTPEAAEAVRSIEGVVAAGRVVLADLTIDAQPGPTDISVAAVEPLEFRPLAPASTAHSQFVWQGLLAGKLYLAHEEQARLGVELGEDLPITGPSGRRTVPLAGLAASGVPNLAGALVSLEAARDLGMGEPRLLLVGMRAGDPVDRVRTQIKERVPGAVVENTRLLAAGTFATGPAAARAFGTIRYQPQEDGSIVPERSWVGRNIATQSVPILGRVTCNRLMFRQLTGALKEIEASGLASKIDVADFHYQGGCYVPRFIDRNPHRSLSRHAWGLAVDINVATNPEGGASMQDPAIVAAFERWGFRWGGRWNPPDPMHFELAGLLQ
jgi:D-alanyl-D-alanine carboxypeptidase-like protein